MCPGQRPRCVEAYRGFYVILAQVNRMWDILESPGKCTLTVLRPTDPWPGCGGLKSDPGSERGVSMKPGS